MIISGRHQSAPSRHSGWEDQLAQVIQRKVSFKIAERPGCPKCFCASGGDGGATVGSNLSMAVWHPVRPCLSTFSEAGVSWSHGAEFPGPTCHRVSTAGARLPAIAKKESADELRRETTGAHYLGDAVGPRSCNF